MKKVSLKAGETVKVVVGKYSKTIDVIKKVDRKKSVVYLENISRIKFTKKLRNEEKKSRKVFIPIHFSNVLIWKEKNS